MPWRCGGQGLESRVSEPLVPVTVMVEVCSLLEDRSDVEAEFRDTVAAGAFNVVQLARPTSPDGEWLDGDHEFVVADEVAERGRRAEFR